MDNVRIKALIQPVVEGLGLDFWGFEYLPQSTRVVLRIYIEGSGGGAVTVGDCQVVSKQVNAVLTVEDPIPGQYILEVSSPGINRLIFNKAQFERYIGHTIKLKMHYPIDGQRNFKVRLTAIENDDLLVEQEGQTLRLSYNEVDKAKLIEI